MILEWMEIYSKNLRVWSTGLTGLAFSHTWLDTWCSLRGKKNRDIGCTGVAVLVLKTWL
jgi:hypothetical protein